MSAAAHIGGNEDIFEIPSGLKGAGAFPYFCDEIQELVLFHTVTNFFFTASSSHHFDYLHRFSIWEEVEIVDSLWRSGAGFGGISN